MSDTIDDITDDTVDLDMTPEEPYYGEDPEAEEDEMVANLNRLYGDWVAELRVHREAAISHDIHQEIDDLIDELDQHIFALVDYVRLRRENSDVDIEVDIERFKTKFDMNVKAAGLAVKVEKLTGEICNLEGKASTMRAKARKMQESSMGDLMGLLVVRNSGVRLSSSWEKPGGFTDSCKLSNLADKLVAEARQLGEKLEEAKREIIKIQISHPLEPDHVNYVSWADLF